MRDGDYTSVGPLILLTDPLSFKDNQALSEWLESHEVVSYRATDAIDAVGFMGDFTQAEIPDLITIPKGDQDDAASVVALMKRLAGVQFDPSVFDYTTESAGRRRCISLEEIDHWLSLRGDRCRAA
jgi:hypothetical protein